jgi:hypothetical protein
VEILIGCLVLGFIIFVILDARSTRADGICLKQTHPYRKLMPFVMRTRNESLVYFDIDVPAEPILLFMKEHPKIGVTQCVVGAMAHTIQKHPELNRFISGRRLYQRKDLIISFSMKRKKLGTASKIAVVRQDVSKESSFVDLCSDIEQKINTERSDEQTYADKEYGLLTSMPRFILRFGVWFIKLLDEYNILPASFINNDGLYCSAFVANLGSLNMKPGYHHLYEWGNCPIFVTSGAIEEKIIVKEGVPAVELVLPIRAAFDERINDGLGVRDAIISLQEALSNPQDILSCE